MNEKKEFQGPELNLNFVVMMVLCFGRPFRLMLSKEGTVGRRETGSINGVWGLLSAVLWFLFWPSEGMVVMLGLALLAQIVHRLKPGKGHSRAMGLSGFHRFTGKGGWVTAGLFGVFMGMGWRLIDQSAGTWMIASGVANLVMLLLLKLKEQAIRHDQMDSILEAQYRRG